MSISIRTKLIIAFVLVFLAGTATGIFIAPRIIRPFLFGRPPATMAQHMREHLRRELDLTPEQMIKAAPIIEQTAEKLERFRNDSHEQVREIFAAQHRQLSALLTPQQREKYEELRRRHIQQMRQRGMLPPSRHGGPPPR